MISRETNERTNGADDANDANGGGDDDDDDVWIEHGETVEGWRDVDGDGGARTRDDDGTDETLGARGGRVDRATRGDFVV